jgi:hypothetical protein
MIVYVRRVRTVAKEDGVHGSQDGAGECVLVEGRALCRRLGVRDAVGGVLLRHGETEENYQENGAT